MKKGERINVTITASDSEGRGICRVDNFAVFVDGSVADVFGIPKLNLLVSAKPTQTFFDRFINNKSVYPVKLKGDVNFNSKLRGPIDRISAH